MGSASRVELEIFVDRSYYVGHVPIMHLLLVALIHANNDLHKEGLGESLSESRAGTFAIA